MELQEGDMITYTHFEDKEVGYILDIRNKAAKVMVLYDLIADITLDSAIQYHTLDKLTDVTVIANYPTPSQLLENNHPEFVL